MMKLLTLINLQQELHKLDGKTINKCKLLKNGKKLAFIFEDATCIVFDGYESNYGNGICISGDSKYDLNHHQKHELGLISDTEYNHAQENPMSLQEVEEREQLAMLIKKYNIEQVKQ